MRSAQLLPWRTAALFLAVGCLSGCTEYVGAMLEKPTDRSVKFCQSAYGPGDILGVGKRRAEDEVKKCVDAAARDGYFPSKHAYTPPPL